MAYGDDLTVLAKAAIEPAGHGGERIEAFGQTGKRQAEVSIT